MSGGRLAVGARLGPYEIVAPLGGGMDEVYKARDTRLESYGYCFDTPDRSIVISGDTSPVQATIDACGGCDVLIHQVNSIEWLKTRPASFQTFAAKFQTTTAQLAELAAAAKPRLLILYHVQAASPEQALKEIASRYTGHVVAGQDLEVY
jgi:ribonuclease BN (tRNA processing enzyme)